MKLDNLKLTITPVIQKTNLGNITDLFEYIEEYNRIYNKTVINISPIILSDPPYLDFTYLPLDYKINCWNKIENWIKNNCHYLDRVFKLKMNQVKYKCYTDAFDSTNLNNFFEFTDIFDTFRNQQIEKINPDLAKIRDKY